MSIVINANNRAAVLLQEGKYMEAIADAKHGITCLRDSTGQAQQEQQEQNTTRRPQISLIPIESASKIVDISSDSTFNVYARAFYFHDCNFSVVEYQNEVAAVLLFNLATAKHLLGLSEANKSKHLEGALQAYKLSIAALQQACSPIEGVLALMLLGIFTNAGHIQSHFWRKPEADECLYHIHSQLPRAIDADAQEQEFFFFTLMAGKLCQSNMAPAA
mmetsp:Transcript_1409/g.1914  ORF Transcript_1409/g.1914 Transcript_1409/m.1914 type:complete len:218 (-) Transcript_1409:140-793(-)|eukprot:CAMPEP_0198143030 /NCGR_PEP_ID=MMETSP1443-20131203/5660_1 /TAXON_ID=186043 /ORGANISM="Entomoneis sp., Strain CCMP2396" /LENGTH=217 /DNA_ID=CAMNT_0043806167 /DNA_START=30 /DNA_END=683 /DNA_ORIENTATION=+